MSSESWVDRALAALEAERLTRQLEAVEPVSKSAVEVRVAGRDLLLFSSNDYLGLSFHPAVRRAISDAALAYGLGPRGSPLICGYTHLHETLERRLATLTRQEAALIFASGYAANLGVITALADAQTTIFSDALNHASIIDGCRMAKQSGTAVVRYRHLDLDHLASLLRSCRSPRRVIITETVFSMDGDVVDLAGLAQLAAEHEALLVTDEGHATLVFGEHGGGLAEHLGVSVDVQIGTLSKAVGGLGGFVATNAATRQLLLNRARSYMFSTALPMPVVAGMLAALDLGGKELRDRLWSHARLFAAARETVLSSPIFPIIVGDEDRVVALSRALLDAGLHVRGIRPPTVPEQTSRLRITLSAAHEEEHVNRLLQELDRLL